jgi:hypothetical protein
MAVSMKMAVFQVVYMVQQPRRQSSSNNIFFAAALIQLWKRCIEIAIHPTN